MAKLNPGLPGINASIPQHSSFFLYDATNIYSSTDSITWISRRHTGSNFGTRSMSYIVDSSNRGKFIAVPNGTQTNILLSDNAISWTSVTAPTGTTWVAPAFSSQKIVSAVSGSTTALNSTDGITWATATLPTSANWLNMNFANGTFLTTGWTSSASPLPAAISTNGTTWTTTTLPFGTGAFVFPRVTSLNNIFFYTNNSSGTSLGVSTDGITWTVRTSPISISNWTINSGAYANNIYALYREEQATGTVILTSTDTITWTTRNLPLFNAVSSSGYLNATNNLFYFYVGAAAKTTVYTSTDTITWTIRTLPAAAAERNIGALKGGSGVFPELSLAVSATELSYLSNSYDYLQSQLDRKAPSSSGTISDMTITNSTFTGTVNGTIISSPVKYVAVSGILNSSNISATSTDGTTWTSRTIPGSFFAGAVVYGNGIYVLPNVNFGSGGSLLAYSSDGITWATTTTPYSDNFSVVYYGSGLFLGISDGNTTNYITSTNGITWTGRTRPTSVTGAIAHGNGRFVWTLGQASYTTTAYSSTDGITWDVRTMPASDYWSTLAFGRNIFVALTNGGNTTAASSTDGVTWTLRTMPVGGSWNNPWNVVYGNNLFVARNPTWNSTSGIISTDGITWTSQSLPANLGNLYFVNGTFYAMTGNSGTTIQVSTNGTTWTTYTMPSYAPWGSIAGMPAYSKSSSQPGSQLSTIAGSSYTVATNDTLLIFNTSATCTVTLPDATTFPGRELTVKQIAAFAVNSASSNVVPLTSTTPGTAILTGAGKFARLVSDGGLWVVIQSN